MPYDDEALAPHFDAWQRSFGAAYAALVLPRLLPVLGRHAPGARRIADLGSGTTDLAIALAARGHAVMGVDRAPTMRAIARRKAAAAGSAAVFVEGDLRTLRLDPPADVAVCVYTVVNQLTGDGDLARALAASTRASRRAASSSSS